MENMKLVLTAEQARRRWASQIAGLVGVSIYMLVISLIESTKLWWPWALGCALVVNMITYLYENIMYTRAFTECTDSGILTRGLAGNRVCSWPHVREITCRTRVWGTDVLVTTVSGARFRLGVPVDRSTMRDPDIAAKVEQIRRYWRAATRGTSA